MSATNSSRGEKRCRSESSGDEAPIEADECNEVVGTDIVVAGFCDVGELTLKSLECPGVPLKSGSLTVPTLPRRTYSTTSATCSTTATSSTCSTTATSSATCSNIDAGGISSSVHHQESASISQLAFNPDPLDVVLDECLFEPTLKYETVLNPIPFLDGVLNESLGGHAVNDETVLDPCLPQAEPAEHLIQSTVKAAVKEHQNTPVRDLLSFETITAGDVLPVNCPENLQAAASTDELSFNTMFEGDPLTDYPSLFEPFPDISYESAVISTEHSENVCDPAQLDMGLEDENISTEQFRNPDKNSSIYPGAQVTVWESFLATLSFMESEHLSGAGLGRLLRLIGLHLPQDCNYFQTSHQFFKLLEGHKEPVRVHYYCNVCYKYRSSSTDLCDTCTDQTRSVIFFISFPFVTQVAQLYKRPNFLADIQHKNSRVKKKPDGIEDIYDGDLYKTAQQTVLASPHNVSLMWNTDGLQLFNSSSFSLWAWYFVVNELPPEKRFLSENMLIAGIWGGVKKPHPNVFLQPIHDELSILRKGISVEVYGSEELLKVQIIVLCGTCDAPAVACFLNMKSHSGFYSCHVCYCKGEKSKRTGDVTVFPYQEHFPLRCKTHYQNQVNYAVQNKVLHNTALLNTPESSGIKGPTVLSYFVSNIFTSTAIDSMHALYLGVMRQLLVLWFDHAHRDEKFSVYSKVKDFNERMFDIRPPHFLQRHPQIIDKLPFWKASEFRSFLFYYAVYVLFGILPQEYYDNFLLFVEGVSLLNSDSVTQEDIVAADMLLDKFVRDFERLYGLRHMSHNMHMVLHLGHCVKNLGPLWITSCFKFEDMNGRILNLVHGSRHAALQIHSKLKIIRDLPLKIHNMDECPAKTYCTKLRQKWMLLKFNSKISDGLLCVGKDYELDNSKSWVVTELVSLGVILQPNVILVRMYHRLLKSKLLFVSKSYGRGRCDSSWIKYCENGVMQCGSIEVFLKVKICACIEYSCSCVKKHFAVVRDVSCEIAFQSPYCQVKNVFRCQLENTVKLVDPLCFQSVLVNVGYRGEHLYLSEPLNMFELE